MMGKHMDEEAKKAIEEQTRKVNEDPILNALVRISAMNNQNFSALCDIVYQLKSDIDLIRTQLEEKK